MIDDLKLDVDKVKSLHSEILSTPIPGESKFSSVLLKSMWKLWLNDHCEMLFREENRIG